MKKRSGKTAYLTQRTHLFKSDEYICSACGCKMDRPFRECPSCHAGMTKSKSDPSWVDEAAIIDIFDDEF